MKRKSLAGCSSPLDEDTFSFSAGSYSDKRRRSMLSRAASTNSPWSDPGIDGASEQAAIVERCLAGMGIHTPHAAGLMSRATGFKLNPSVTSAGGDTRGWPSAFSNCSASPECGEQAPEDDFVLFCSQTYVPTSQRSDTPHAEGGGGCLTRDGSQVDCLMHFQFPVDTSSNQANVQLSSAWYTSSTRRRGNSSTVAAQGASAGTARHVTPPSMGVWPPAALCTTTPELVDEPGDPLFHGAYHPVSPSPASATPEQGLLAPAAASGGSTAKERPLFHLFRPLSQRKVLHIVRHGESEYNRAVVESAQFADPHIFDPRLTKRGIEQAFKLQQKLTELQLKHPDLLIVSSPLTRCLQTMMIACASGTKCMKAAQKSVVERLGSRLRIRPELSEHVACAGDVGRPKAQLMAEFPQLQPYLQELDEVWWYTPVSSDTTTPLNCAVQRKFSSTESKEQLKQRIQQFERWLGSMPNQCVVLFGHSTFWKTFLGQKTRMKNGEIIKHHW